MIVKKINASEVLELRNLVLRPNQTKEQCVWPKDHLPSTFHLGVIYDSSAFDQKVNQIICVASFEQEISPHFKSQNQYRLRGMATHPNHRKRGAAEKLILEGERILKSQNIDLLWFNARRVAYGFYEKLGFQHLGDEFTIEDVGPHKVMWKQLG